MLYVGLLIALGVVVYAAGTGNRVEAPRQSGVQVRRDAYCLTVIDPDGRTLHPYDLEHLTRLAIRTERDGYWLELDFGQGRGAERVELHETDAGVAALLDSFLKSPPKGADFSRFGEAMETRRPRTFVFFNSP